MKFWLKLLNYLNAALIMIVLAGFVAGMIRPSWILWGKSETRLIVVLLCGWILVLWLMLYFFISIVTVPAGLAKADRLWKRCQKSEAVELYVLLLKLYEWTLNRFIAKSDTEILLNLAKVASSIKIRVPEKMRPHIQELCKTEGEYDPEDFKWRIAVTEEDKMRRIVNALKYGDSKNRKSMISEVVDSEIHTVDVLYELANLLGDAHEDVRLKAGETFWQLKGVDYAIHTLRDEYVSPVYLSREDVLLGLGVLKGAAVEEASIKKLLDEKWQNCPLPGDIKDGESKD